MIIINFPFPQQSKDKLIIRLVFCLSGPGIRQQPNAVLSLQYWLQQTFTHPWKGLRISESGKLLHVESEIQLQESGILLTTRIQNSTSTDKGCRIQYLTSGIHDVESRIQDCLRFPYMGRILQVSLRLILGTQCLPFLWQIYHVPFKKLYLCCYLQCLRKLYLIGKGQN